MINFKKGAPVLGATALLFILVVIIWQIPRLQATQFGLSGKEQADVENAARQTLIQSIGGFFFFVTAFLTWRNVQIAQRNLQIADDKNITERFSRAIEQLSSDDKMEVRLGGIYSLERIARDSPNDQWVIMEVLTAFIREKSSIHYPYDEQEQEDKPSLKIATDIQATLTVIGSRDSTKDQGKLLNLKNTDLSGADLTGANFNKADLSEADLIGANLKGASLHETNFRQTKLSTEYYDTLPSLSMRGATSTWEIKWLRRLEDGRWKPYFPDQDPNRWHPDPENLFKKPDTTEQE